MSKKQDEKENNSNNNDIRNIEYRPINLHRLITNNTVTQHLLSRPSGPRGKSALGPNSRASALEEL